MFDQFDQCELILILHFSCNLNSNTFKYLKKKKVYNNGDESNDECDWKCLVKP